MTQNIQVSSDARTRVNLLSNLPLRKLDDVEVLMNKLFLASVTVASPT